MFRFSTACVTVRDDNGYTVLMTRELEAVDWRGIRREYFFDRSQNCRWSPASTTLISPTG
jgi:hypothetical protein